MHHSQKRPSSTNKCMQFFRQEQKKLPFILYNVTITPKKLWMCSRRCKCIDNHVIHLKKQHVHNWLFYQYPRTDQFCMLIWYCPACTIPRHYEFETNDDRLGKALSRDVWGKTETQTASLTGTTHFNKQTNSISPTTRDHKHSSTNVSCIITNVSP